MRSTVPGYATLLAAVGEDTEGLDVAPTNSGFGSFGGDLIVASEGSGLLRAITPGGHVTVVNPNAPIGGAEMLSFVPQNLGASGSSLEGFYASNYTPNVVFASASQFSPYLGDVIVTGEFSHVVTDVHWNGSAFVMTNIGTFPNQPEDGIFVTAAIVNPGGGGGGSVPEPASVLLMGGGFALLGLLGRRRPA